MPNDPDLTGAASGEPATSEGITRFTASASANAEKARSAGSRTKPVSPGKIALWAGVLAAGLASLAPIIEATSARLSGQVLMQADPATLQAALTQPLPASASADYFETLSELAMDVAPANPAAAKAAAERAVALDPSRAQAWARIAWLDYRDAKGVGPRAIAAIDKSMTACLLCDRDLVRWRFNFILANWTSFPDALRRKAFEGADMLRWAGEPGDADFLAEMRTKAASAGIPYDAYRTAVATPVKSWDVQS